MASLPSNFKVILTPHDTGVTLDFPLAEDLRERGRRRAWRTFEVGILVLVSTVLGYVALVMAELRWQQAFLVVPFFGGLICLISAARQAWSAWDQPGREEDVRQLSVRGDLLIRTARDQSKKIWYRDEVYTVVVEAYDEKGESTLLVVSQNGDRTPLGDGLARPELDWIAAELRHALRKEAAGLVDTLAHAIEANRRTPETRIAQDIPPFDGQDCLPDPPECAEY